ncbi:hypothetical protein Hypma_005128 [Hypsizygus marmoreus]|uniref:Uncharacterized protein n=1 Tax=Hypsizygus marmoreus TaxID=39966 RepID=A0A369K7L9_HYPMA|nr:hypothetical protein Hypma_005128 [Hypsizygus marmoreus]
MMSYPLRPPAPCNARTNPLIPPHAPTPLARNDEANLPNPVVPGEVKERSMLQWDNAASQQATSRKTRRHEMLAPITDPLHGGEPQDAEHRSPSRVQRFQPTALPPTATPQTPFHPLSRPVQHATTPYRPSHPRAQYSTEAIARASYITPSLSAHLPPPHPQALYSTIPLPNVPIDGAKPQIHSFLSYFSTATAEPTTNPAKKGGQHHDEAATCPGQSFLTIQVFHTGDIIQVFASSGPGSYVTVGDVIGALEEATSSMNGAREGFWPGEEILRTMTIGNPLLVWNALRYRFGTKVGLYIRSGHDSWIFRIK